MPSCTAVTDTLLSFKLHMTIVRVWNVPPFVLLLMSH